MKNSRTTFGQFIAKKRREYGWNLRYTASLIKKEDGSSITFQYLSELENDRRNPPSDYLIERIAAALKIPAAILYIKARRVPAYIDSENEVIAADALKDLHEKLRAA